MDIATLEALEFPEVLRALAENAVTAPGKDLLLALRPSADADRIEEEFRYYSEAFSFIEESATFPLAGTNDLSPVLKRSFPSGSFLLPDEFLLVRDNLRVTVELKKLLKPSFNKRFPLITSRLEVLSEAVPLLRELERVFDDKGFIADGASARLFDIRKRMLRVKERARALLDGFLKEKETKELLQEEIITIRDDRYVLSVVAGRQSEVPGVIHGRSGSGATFFIEPLGLVEINNSLSVLKKEERSEEIEILKGLTAGVVGEKEALLSDLEVIAWVDFLQAKVFFAKELKAVVPEIKKRGAVNFKEARHPLLVLKERAGGGAVVAVDVTVPEDTRVVVISGANTGGKTVALKTLGLLTLMSSSAIPVPTGEASSAVVFSEIFADVGDSQDIEASLSTFSAHVKRLSGFLSGAGPNSLVLIDEIGAGTDPAEGGALALAAIETLRKEGALVAVTTHLNILKAEATVNPAYQNVSVAFDEKTLRPLYRLLYGMPGASFGLNIAESLGLPRKLTDLAGTYIQEKEGAFVESVKMIEEEKEKLAALKEKLTALAAKREAALKRLRDGREALLKKAGLRIEALVETAEAEIRVLTKKFEMEGRRGPKARKEVREAGLRVLEKFSPAKRERFVPAEGERVRISGSGTLGVVLRVDAGAARAELMVGNLKVWVDCKRLERVNGPAPHAATAKNAGVDADMEARLTVNLLGMRSEEAIRVVIKFLDNAHAEGLERVEIIHGLGTGALKKMVSGFLRESKLVKSFYPAAPSGGGAGVTVVELK